MPHSDQFWNMHRCLTRPHDVKSPEGGLEEENKIKLKSNDNKWKQLFVYKIKELLPWIWHWTACCRFHSRCDDNSLSNNKEQCFWVDVTLAFGSQMITQGLSDSRVIVRKSGDRVKGISSRNESSFSPDLCKSFPPQITSTVEAPALNHSVGVLQPGTWKSTHLGYSLALFLFPSFRVCLFHMLILPVRTQVNESVAKCLFSAFSVPTKKPHGDAEKLAWSDPGR